MECSSPHTPPSGSRLHSEILERIRRNASRIGSEVKHDILSLLAEYSMYHVIKRILDTLDYLDIYSCSTVSKTWNSILHHHLDNSMRLKMGWSEESPRIKIIQCDKTRSVCTINELTSDGESLFFGTGHPGNLELWDRRPLPNRRWIQKSAHPEGVYALELSSKHCFSGGGEDGVINIWDRNEGNLLQSIKAHEYIVWKIGLIPTEGSFFTASYDCSINLYSSLEEDNKCTLTRSLKGPNTWADALQCDGVALLTQDEDNHDLSVWELNWSPKNGDAAHPFYIRFTLSGHEDEVNTALFYKKEFILSGSSDKTLRLWSYSNGDCLRVLKGLRGKVWCSDMNSALIVAGGRYGQIGVWKLEDEKEAEEGRIVQPHSHVTAVGSIKLEKIGLLSGDGEGHVFELDFWSSKRICSAPS